MPDHSGNIQPQLDLEEHAHLAKARRVAIVGTDGINYYEAKVNSSGELSTTGGGGGGGGTVDQGTGGVSPWLVKIDQTGTNNDVNISGTVDVSGSTVTIQEPLSVDDNGSSLTVDGTVAATQGTSPWVVSGTVTITDGSGPVTVDGTVTANQGTSPWVTADNQTLVDNAGFTDGASKVFPSGFIFDETAGTALTENDVAAARLDSKRAIVVTVEDASTRGRRAQVDANGKFAVNSTSTEGRQDNAPFGIDTDFVIPIGFILDETAGGALSENEIGAARQDTKRCVITTIEDATTRGQRMSVSSGGELSLTELPAAAALADGAANPTTTSVGALNLECKYVDGTLSWDRVPHSYYQNRTSVGTGSGAGTAIDMTMGPCSKFGLEIENQSGTTSAWNIDLQGSMDNGAYFLLTNQTNATGNPQLTFTADKPVRYVRSNVNSVTGGGTVRVRIIAMQH